MRPKIVKTVAVQAKCGLTTDLAFQVRWRQCDQTAVASCGAAGKVSFGEFLVSLNVATHGNAEDKLRWAFRMYDVDRSGTISLAEVTDILKVFLLTNSQKCKKVTKVQTRKKCRPTMHQVGHKSRRSG